MARNFIQIIFSLMTMISYAPVVAAENVLVPSDTRLKVVVVSPVNALSSRPGDQIVLRTMEEITSDGNVVIPAGSKIMGTVWIPATIEHMKFSKAVGLKFDSLSTARGEQVPVVFDVLTIGGFMPLYREGLPAPVRIKVYPSPPQEPGTAISYGPPWLTTKGWHSRGYSGPSQAKKAPVDFVVPAHTTLLFAKRDEKLDIKSGDQFSLHIAVAMTLHVKRRTKFTQNKFR